MQPSAKPSRRRRLARAFHYLAAASVLLALEILLFGGIGVEIALHLVSATHVANPLVAAAALTALGWLLDRQTPLSATPTVRGFVWLARLLKRPTSRQGAAAVAGVVLVVGLGVWGRVHHWHHATLAAKYEAEGRNDLAAAHFLSATVPLDPDNRVMHEKAAYAYWRAAMHPECIAQVEPAFKAGRLLGRRASRALWSCYRAVGRYDEAIEVATVAMGTHETLESECAGVIAQLKRERQPDLGGNAPVELFVPSAAAPGVDTLYLAGNWSAAGEQSEVLAWAPVPMQKTAEGFVAEVRLGPSADFPYDAVATTTPDFTTPALAIAQFRPETLGEQRRIEMVRQPPLGWVPPLMQRRPGADGKKRVLALWPDAGSWFLLNAYAHRGVMPNAARLLRQGTRAEMISTNPPFTSTAYRRMVEMEPSGTGPEDASLLRTVMIQLKGIPFLDGIFPDSLVAGEGAGKTIYTVMAEHGVSGANLVFSDQFVSAKNDLQTTDGKKLELDESALYSSKEERAMDDDETAWVLREVLHVDPEAEKVRYETLEALSIFMLGIQNTEGKARAGLDAWQKNDLDFMLLRFPSVDILSHKYFETVEGSFVENPMLETYRHLDDAIGRFVATLDGDDTLILVSDHGIAGTLHHHRSCILVMEGPGLPPGHALPTMPIGHFPAVVLSRFGLSEKTELLGAEYREVLLGAAPTPPVTDDKALARPQ